MRTSKKEFDSDCTGNGLYLQEVQRLFLSQLSSDSPNIPSTLISALSQTCYHSRNDLKGFRETLLCMEEAYDTKPCWPCNQKAHRQAWTKYTTFKTLLSVYANKLLSGFSSVKFWLWLSKEPVMHTFTTLQENILPLGSQYSSTRSFFCDCEEFTKKIKVNSKFKSWDQGDCVQSVCVLIWRNVNDGLSVCMWVYVGGCSNVYTVCWMHIQYQWE